MLGSSQPSNAQRLIELRQRKLPRREQGVSLTAVERAEIQGSAPWEQTEASEDPCGEERERWRDGDGEGGGKGHGLEAREPVFSGMLDL